MTLSLEALAMSGADYDEWGLDIEKWEDDDASQFPPPHLLLEESENEQPVKVVKQDTKIVSPRLVDPELCLRRRYNRGGQ
ncbi:hypothetical protein HRI_000463600 [Hibiscus trionum]|uniref:Uncharacterized protein n=1 Tax=Hibiscus trionum TaxID=183268 RepID=A0A9W7H055_HIBTR|nr:hypothetical protein HRI_000463600 [Hibiscus trionum]